MKRAKRMQRAVLVYQCGIANVFELVPQKTGEPIRRRLMQHAFSPCENFARGLQAAGVEVSSAWCNEAGDIVDREWRTDFDEAPFRESMCPVV